MPMRPVSQVISDLRYVKTLIAEYEWGDDDKYKKLLAAERELEDELQEIEDTI